VSHTCRLAILASHPIQYFTPIYRRLAQRPGLDVEVMYYRDFGVRAQFDRQFAREIVWDTDQLSGYPHRFLRNVSPVSDTFNPLHAINPGAFTRMLRGYDALWVNGYVYPSNWLAAIAAKMRGTKLLLRSDLRLYHRRRRRWYHLPRDLVLRGWIRAADAILYVGRANREAYEHYGARPEQFFFTPHSVDVDEIARVAGAARENLAALRSQWGLPTDAVIVQFVGKLTAQKHVDRMLDLAKHLETARAHVMIAGSGPLEETLRRSATDRGLRNITFLGFVNQARIAEVYAAGDIFVLPSEGEAWGLAVNEAMAAGVVPVISSEVGAAADLITQGETGFVFPFGDWRAMTEQVTRLVSDEPLRREMAKRARARVERYGYDAAADGIIECLTALGVYRTPVPATAPRELAHVRH
jgi:glycosyltransferase involved in cell wall biosynthesis